MDIEALWTKALKETEIHRQRLEYLATFQPTELSYILLSKSDVSPEDTVVRKGRIEVMQPLIIVPPDYPMFEGFNFKDDVGLEGDSIRSFLYMRGVRLPSLKYYNRTFTLDVWEIGLSDALAKVKNELARREDTRTGLIVGPNDAWQFSLLIYVASLIDRSFANDVKRIMDKYQEDQG